MSFDILEGLPDALDEDRRRRYEAALARAVRFANRLPLVRTFAPHNGTDEKKRERGRSQLEDFVFHGVFEADHESSSTRKHEAQLGQEKAVYFHVGRPHPQYGECVIVLKAIRTDKFAITPFGLFNVTKPEPDTDPKYYLHPVSTFSEEERKEFFRLNTWGNDWRSRAEKYLAFYHDGLIANYFASNGICPLVCRNTALGKSIWSPPTGDWRAWTLEARFFSLVQLTAPEEVLFLVMTEAAGAFIRHKTAELSKIRDFAFFDLDLAPEYINGATQVAQLAEFYVRRYLELEVKAS
jgi:hypothetical protein